LSLGAKERRFAADSGQKYEVNQSEGLGGPNFLVQLLLLRQAAYLVYF